jgi:iron complex transport system ATP-binding protein
VSLEASDLSFAYRAGPPVLDGLSFGPRSGAVTGVIGPNGSGKSTLLRLLLGVERPTRGRATLDGTDIASIPVRDRAKRIAFIPQKTSPAFGFTVRECIRMGRLSTPARAEAATDKALARIGLTLRANDAFDTLSAGQQQKAILARALAQLDGAASPVFLADEPASALDPAHTLEAMTILRESAAAGATVITVLHDLPTAARFCDDCLILAPGGRVLGFGSTPTVLVPHILEQAFSVRFTRGEPALVASLPASPQPTTIQP